MCLCQRLKQGKTADGTLAGRDRTGVLSALILDLMGAPLELIGLEYAITKIGGQHMKEKMLPKAFAFLGAPLDGSLADLTEILRQRPEVRGYMTTSADAMVDFVVVVLHGKYGGSEGYLRGCLGLSEADIAAVRKNLAPRTAT